MRDEDRGRRERWQRIEQIYTQALQLEPEGDARATLLDEAWAGDADLRRSVESLLACEPRARSFLEMPALEIAAHLVNQQPDADLVGRRIGPYVVHAWLGSGGMGDVYRARDDNLHRDVALKVLPELFALDPGPPTGTTSPRVRSRADRIARFKQEAQVLAALSHPHIAAIYGFEESGRICALVLELVEGPTLADRMSRGPIAPDEALPIARQIAEALEAAHEQGIVHRDLKPSNIGLAPDGTVKVLDFGLATALQPAAVTGGGAMVSPTTPNWPMVPANTILGTPAYVSPEQAKGRGTDKRADVWAFGAVLYEMLSGRRAFKGERTSDILESVLHQDIDWSVLPPSTPMPVRRLIARCLDRDVKRRLRDIGEARIVLEEPDALDEQQQAFVMPSRRWAGASTAVLGVLAGAVLVAAGAWLLGPRPATPPVIRFTLTLPQERSLTLPTPHHIVALSPDGSQMVYVGNGRLYVQPMAELDAHALSGSEFTQGAVTEPVFSPDGQSIAFWSRTDRTLKTIPITGGPPVTVCQADSPFGLSWGNQGLLFGVRHKGIMRVSANGTPELLARVEGDEQAHGPQLLPDGRHLLFTIATGTGSDRWEKARVVVQSLASGERKTLLENATDARYVPTGHIVYAARGGVFAVAFDPRRREAVGRPVSMMAGVRRSHGGATGAAQFSVSNTGSLIFVPGPITKAEGGYQEIVVADRTGRLERLPLPPGPYTEVRASPDGRRIAIAANDDKEAMIYVYDRSGSTAMQRLTLGGNNRAPVWSADSTRVAFQSDRDGAWAIYWQLADGGGSAERLTVPARGEAHVPESWIPTGGGFLFSVAKGNERSLWTFTLQERQAKPFGDVHSSIPTGATFSPDGRWVAYASAKPETASMAIYVQPFPATGATYPLFVRQPANGPTNAPHKPVWSTDGKELFYVPRIGEFEVVRITMQPRFAFSNPVTVPRAFNPGRPDLRRMYDISPDGRFLGLVPTERTYAEVFGTSRIQVILNWLRR